MVEIIIYKNKTNIADKTILCNSLLLGSNGTQFSQSLSGIQSAEIKQININNPTNIIIPKIYVGVGIKPCTIKTIFIMKTKIDNTKNVIFIELLFIFC